MRRFIQLAAIFIFAAAVAHGQTAALPVYACVQAGVQAKTSGLPSSNYMQGIIPSCLVTIYMTGTTNVATTSPQSPFTANTDGSIPPIYAAVNQGYDVVLSGGIAPNTYPTPVTLTGLYPGFEFSGGGSGNCSGTLTAGYYPIVSAGPCALGNGKISDLSGQLLIANTGASGTLITDPSSIEIHETGEFGGDGIDIINQGENGGIALIDLGAAGLTLSEAGGPLIIESEGSIQLNNGGAQGTSLTDTGGEGITLHTTGGGGIALDGQVTINVPNTVLPYGDSYWLLMNTAGQWSSNITTGYWVNGYDGSVWTGRLTATDNIPYVDSAFADNVTGLNDLTSNAGATFTGPDDTNYCVVIAGNGTPDTFNWGYFPIGAAHVCTNGATNVAMTGTAQALAQGVQITFASTTGHHIGDDWIVQGLAEMSIIQQRNDLSGSPTQNFRVYPNGTTAAPEFDILNPSTGVHSPFSSFNLGDWTDSGVANGNCPVWNSTTSKWTPGACGSGSMVYPGANTIGVANSGNTAWRTPLYSDITALFGSGSCSGYLKSDGTCGTSSGMVWPTTAGIPYWTSGTAWGGAYNSSTPIPANYLPTALSSSNSVNGTSIPASATLCTTSSVCSGYQASGSYLTSVTADAPLSGAGTSGSHLSMHVADSSDNGYLSSTDWSTFNGKQAALGFTPAHSGANSDITSLSGLTTPLSVAQGGTGTATPGLVAGTNVTISGTWPDQTINAAGSGSGTVTDGSGTTTTPEFAESTGTAHVIQYRTPTQALGDMGAAPAVGSTTDETSSWTLAANGVYRFTGSSGSNATTPSTVGTTGLISFVNAGTANVTVVTGGPTLVCIPSSCIVPVGAGAFINTDGTDQYANISNANGSAFGTAANDASLSLIKGTYTDGDWCAYASSGTLLNCNKSAPQVNLSLAAGTYANGDMCTYASSGTLLNCNTAIPGVPYVLQVGGSGLSAGDTVNFNNTTPAAETNGINIHFQTSKASTTDSVSGEVVGNGTATNFLNGTGGWTVPAGTYSLPTQYTIEPCSVTLSNGGSAIAAATYSTIFNGSCLNVYGVTYTIAHASVYSDNSSGSSTCAVTDSATNAVLSASTAANSAWLNNADANISGTYYTEASGHWLNFSIVADGTSKIVKCVLTLTR